MTKFTRSGRFFSKNGKKYTLITGGAGFIGTNLAHQLLYAGEPVVILDNLSREGVHLNLQWLMQQHGNLLAAEIADITDVQALRKVAAKASFVFHFAAQVAVTKSLEDPAHDFDVNLLGTVRLLETLRSLKNPPPLLFTSTNKVYGNISDLPLLKKITRFEVSDKRIRQSGISESRPLEFHTPYGCSKGSADQYVLDYSRMFGIPTVVFRMSCIYGPHQFGTEDQGWVAHFLIRALNREPVFLYGNGKQVRDILYVEDLVKAFLLARKNIRRIQGRGFNIGGGPENTISLLELIDLIWK